MRHLDNMAKVMLATGSSSLTAILRILHVALQRQQFDVFLSSSASMALTRRLLRADLCNILTPQFSGLQMRHNVAFYSSCPSS